MHLFNAIAAMSENRVIGKQGKLPWHLPEEYRWFKHKTMGGTMIMGRKTFESIGKALPGRQTVVLSRGILASRHGEIYCDEKTLDPALVALPQPYWICGGAEIYRRFLPSCQAIYLTVVKRTISDGDAFIPEFENMFYQNGVIHENNSFRIEHWLNRKVEEPSKFPAGDWPFADDPEK